jgi:hypothetical protein
MASRPLYRLERESAGGKVEAINNYHSKTEAERDARAFRRYIKAAPLGNVWKYHVRRLTTGEAATSENPAGIRARVHQLTSGQKTLTKGRKYDIHSLRFIGWTPGDGTGSQGYNAFDYFSPNGTYLGADEHKIQPIFGVQNPSSIHAQVRRLPSGQIQLKIPIGRSENPHSVIAQLKRVFGKRVKAVEMVGGKKHNPSSDEKITHSTKKAHLIKSSKGVYPDDLLKTYCGLTLTHAAYRRGEKGPWCGPCTRFAPSGSTTG